MDYKTYALIKQDLNSFSLDELHMLADYYNIDKSGKVELIPKLVENIYGYKYAEMATDSVAFRKVGLNASEYKELDILMRDLGKALEKYKVRYWMDGGTMLGSLRHRGMIPWDDDVDFGVLDIDEDKLHKALKSLEGKYDVDWDEETSPVCRRVIISSKKTAEGFPFAEFFIYKIKKGRTHFRCKEDEDSWGKKCYHELKNLFPLRKYPYGNVDLQGPNNPIPFLNTCYGDDWNNVAYREQSHKGGFFYDDRRVRLTKFDHVNSKNDDHVYDPLSNKWVKKGSAAH